VSKGTALRNVRVDDALWQAALAAAKARGESLSEVIRRKLSEYVTGA
jgi:predicted HicB family RNase H-like nuclease